MNVIIWLLFCFRFGGKTFHFFKKWTTLNRMRKICHQRDYNVNENSIYCDTIQIDCSISCLWLCFLCDFIVLFKIVDWVSWHCIQLLLCCSVDFSFRFIQFFFVLLFRYDRIICFRYTNMNARMCKKRNSWTSNWNKQKFVHTLVYVLMLRSHCCSIYYAICISCVMCVRLFCSIYLFIKKN